MLSERVFILANALQLELDVRTSPGVVRSHLDAVLNVVLVFLETLSTRVLLC